MGLPFQFGVGTWPPLLVDEVREMVEREFHVIDFHFDISEGCPTFIIERAPDLKIRFKRLAYKMKQRGYLPFLREERGSLVLRVTAKPVPRKSRIEVNIAFFIVTFATVFVSSYFFFCKGTLINEFFGMPALPTAVMLTALIFVILGVHEMGHKIACEFDGISATMPYFIPGPPPYGTFGAVILQREFPVNRDELFDLGISGPLAGFIATVFVAFLSLQLSFLVPTAQVEQWLIMGYVSSLPMPPLLILISMLRPTPPGFELVYSPIFAAAWLGAFVTYLNLLPIWQLDGGHIIRAVGGRKYHKILSIAFLAFLFVTGMFLMAIILLLLGALGGFEHAGPLDDVSPLSTSRKLLFVFALVMLGLCAIITFPF